MLELARQEMHSVQYAAYNTQIKNAAVSVKNEVLEMVQRVQEKMGRLALPIVSAKYLAKIPNRDKVDKITPKAWRTEKEQLEKEMPVLRSERARACDDLAFAEVISYNEANLERVEQNESRQRNRQQTVSRTVGRTKRRKNCEYENLFVRLIELFTFLCYNYHGFLYSYARRVALITN